MVPSRARGSTPSSPKALDLAPPNGGSSSLALAGFLSIIAPSSDERSPSPVLAGEGLFYVLETEQTRSKNQYTYCTNLESRYLQNAPTPFSRPSDILIPLSAKPPPKGGKKPSRHFDRKNALLAGLNCWEGRFFSFPHLLSSIPLETPPHQFTGSGKCPSALDIKLPTLPQSGAQGRKTASKGLRTVVLPYRRIIENIYRKSQKIY